MMTTSNLFLCASFNADIILKKYIVKKISNLLYIGVVYSNLKINKKQKNSFKLTKLAVFNSLNYIKRYDVIK